MDRLLFAPGQEVMDTDLLSAQKNAMIAIGALIESTLGNSAVVSGLGATAVSTSGTFAINLARGFIYELEEVDPNAFGNLGTDTARSVMKCGISLSSVAVTITGAAPPTVGQSVNYLVSAAFSETDGTSTAVPFVNASNPSVPLSVTQNTVRAQGIVFEVTPGSAAATGSQTTPAPPAGYVPLYVVTVTQGQVEVTQANITLAPGAPFLYQPQKSFYGGTGYARQSIDGFIEQGGVSTTSSGGTVTINLPIPFATGEYSIIATVTGSPTYIVGNVQVGSVTVVNGMLTAITFVTGGTTSGNAGPISFYWEAKGY